MVKADTSYIEPWPVLLGCDEAKQKNGVDTRILQMAGFHEE